MINHVTLRVGDVEKSTAFYGQLLGVLGYKKMGPYDGAVGFAAGKSSLWIVKEDYITKGAHVAFSAESKEMVQAFHSAGLAAGGTDNGAPGPRPEYGDNYYAAFVLDPDGNNIEAVYNK